MITHSHIQEIINLTQDSIADNEQFLSTADYDTDIDAVVTQRKANLAILKHWSIIQQIAYAIDEAINDKDIDLVISTRKEMQLTLSTMTDEW